MGTCGNLHEPSKDKGHQDGEIMTQVCACGVRDRHAFLARTPDPPAKELVDGAEVDEQAAAIPYPPTHTTTC